MIGSILGFFAFYLLHLPHTLVAVAAGVVFAIPLKALAVRLKAWFKKQASSAATKI